LVPAITSVTTNMALDTTTSSDVNHPTPILYVNSGNNMYALHIGASTIDKYCTASPAGAPPGSPIIFGAGSTATAVVTGGYQVTAYRTANMSAAGGACTAVDLKSFGITTARPTLGPPSANGANVYFAYDDTEAGGTGNLTVKSISFNGTFGTASSTNLTFEPTTNGGQAAVSPTSEVFFGDNGTKKFYDFDTSLTQQHASSALGASQLVFTQPTISGGLLFGMTNQLIAYNAPTLTPAWTALNGVTQVTPPAVGVGMLYLSDASTKAIHAIDSVSGTTTRSDKWTYSGSGTTTPVTTISSLTTEPTLASDGTLYFGDNGGRVYALITDTAPAATGANDWPRTGYDNCNSNHAANTGFNCQ
jgi:hypothetical protein